MRPCKPEAHAGSMRPRIYIPAKRLVEVAGGALKEQEIARALDEVGSLRTASPRDVR
jgi:hypothetical protein